MAKINLNKAKVLVDELGLVEEYSRELKAEVEERKKTLHPYKGQTIITDEFQCSIYEQQGQMLDKAKLMKKFKLTEAQLASCYVKKSVATVVTIKRLGTTKKEQREAFQAEAKRKVKISTPKG